MIIVKTKEEIDRMREGGKILATILDNLEKNIMAGMTTQDLEDLALKMIKDYGGVPAFKGYKGYPCALCVSLNEEVVHGIPKPERIIKNGDIVGLDLGLQYKGYYTDAAITVPVGKVSKTANKLINVTKECLYLGIKQIKKGSVISDISKAVQNHAEKNNFSVVRDLVGHGVGKEVHEDPKIPNFFTPKANEKLIPGMTLAIEPMINEGKSGVAVRPDNWTIVTQDSSLSAHFEHTVAVLEDGYEILTKI